MNPGTHDPTSPNFNPRKSPLPSDAESVYANAIKVGDREPGTGTLYFGKSANGKYYRYSGQNGEVHWSGEMAPNKVPRAIKKQLDHTQGS